MARIVERQDTLTVVGHADQRRFDGDSASLARAVLELLRAPLTDAQLLEGLKAQFEGVASRAGLIDELLGHLRATHAVIPHVETAAPSRPLHGTRVLLAASGAVAASFTPMLVTGLQSAGSEVRVALTPHARRFVSTRALAALTHRDVLMSLWTGKTTAPAPHIEAAEWADVVVVAPASATTLARLATGDCSEVVAATAIATKAPVVLAASMNPKMHAAPSVKRNIAQLRDDGFYLVWPSWGLEVAQTPEQRKLLLGPMLPADSLVDIVAALAPRRPTTPRPDAAFWDDHYVHGTPPWHSETLDEGLRSAMGAGRGRLLDLGCGLGTVAIEAARAGFEVTATDVSPIAIAAAKERARGVAIEFVVDDLLHSNLRATFDVIVDRAVLHTLPAASHDRYVRHVTRLLTVGGRLVLEAHCDPEEARHLGTQAFDERRLHALLAPELEIVASSASTIAGAKALRVVAVRR